MLLCGSRAGSPRAVSPGTARRKNNQTRGDASASPQGEALQTDCYIISNIVQSMSEIITSGGGNGKNFRSGVCKINELPEPLSARTGGPVFF